jgi:hypothetical protein
LARVAFAIDQRQDFYLSLGFLRLLRERDPTVEAVALLLADRVAPEFESRLRAFDRLELIGTCAHPPRPRAVPGELRRIGRLQRRARRLSLDPTDALVAYSFRELVLNVLIRALRPRPRLVAVRKCDHALERLQNRPRPLRSANLNLWNRLFGVSAQRYRWLPDSNRVGSGTYLRNPYDYEFCLNPAEVVRPGGSEIPYPLPLLRDGAATGARPTIVFLGERYPLAEGVPGEPFLERFNGVLAYLRETFPAHRLVFKPRQDIASLGLDLDGFEVAHGDVLLEGLLLEDPGIEMVLSFKSSGSSMAALYGCQGYLLYPLLDLPDGFRAGLDAYFEPYRGIVHFVDELGQLSARDSVRPPVGAARLGELSSPLLDVLLG